MLNLSVDVSMLDLFALSSHAPCPSGDATLADLSRQASLADRSPPVHDPVHLISNTPTI